MSEMRPHDIPKRIENNSDGQPKTAGKQAIGFARGSPNKFTLHDSAVACLQGSWVLGLGSRAGNFQGCIVSRFQSSRVSWFQISKLTAAYMLARFQGCMVVRFQGSREPRLHDFNVSRSQDLRSKESKGRASVF